MVVASEVNKLTAVIKPFVTTLKMPSKINDDDDQEDCAIKISMKKGKAQIYNDGSNTLSVPIWGYKGEYPGPLIEISERNVVTTIEWVNEIKKEDLLEKVVQADSIQYPYPDNLTIPQNVLDTGQFGNSVMPSMPPALNEHTMGAKGEAFLSVHLHGGKTIPASDGWPESMLAPVTVNKKTEEKEEQSLLCRYENKQRAMMLWYHDHAMHTTRLNNFAGLAGLWIIRDSEEAELPLPEDELPLVIQDRNLTGFNGFEDAENAKFLHRVEHGEGPLEFFGPLTLVNGCIWPVKEVESKAYRLRILNGSNSRFYRLRFAEKLPENQGYEWIDISGAVKQIGTDCGLLNQPIDLPDNNSLTLAPAERADLIVDFSEFSGKDIVLLNTAEAPFSNGDPLSPDANGLFVDNPDSYMNGEDAWRTPYPEVMMFSVDTTVKQDYESYDFSDLQTQMQNSVLSYLREDEHIKGEDPTGNDIQEIRTVVLIEKTEIHRKPNPNPNNETYKKVVLVEWELEEIEKLEVSSEVPTILEGKRTIEITEDADPNTTKTYIVTAERFQDPVNWIVKLNSTEQWRFINLTADTHPMHVHLVQFKAVSRRRADISEVNKECTFPNGDPVNVDNNGALDIVEAVDCLSLSGTPIKIDISTAVALDENEQGFKDTIRVNPGEIVEIVAKFEGHCGRYVYHCHLLEHEDHDMMRQFIVTRDDNMGEMHMSPISVGKP